MLELIPAAKVGHIGMYRDPETAEPIEYYCKLPADCANREVFVVDPMLATGGSAVAALDMLKKRGVKNIHFMCIIAAPEGVKRLTEAHPDVDVYIGERSMIISMSTNILCRDSEMQETEFSEPSNNNDDNSCRLP